MTAGGQAEHCIERNERVLHGGILFERKKLFCFDNKYAV